MSFRRRNSSRAWSCHILRHAGLVHRLFELRDFGRLALFAFAELPLDRRHLLAQQDLALPLVQRRLVCWPISSTAAAPRCDARA